MRRAYIIQDPFCVEAVSFARALWLNHGLRPICVYSSDRLRHDTEQTYAEFRGDNVETARVVPAGDPAALKAFVEQIATEFEVVAVVPHNEFVVQSGADLAEYLGLDWTDPDALRLFRDKAKQREHMRQHAPDVRVPDHRVVTSGAELRDGWLPPRFVLKPNDGLGNKHIGIFERDEIDQAVAHIERTPGLVWIVDEFIGGGEYHVDGQVRAGGEVDVLGVFEYRRGEANGEPTVYLTEMQIHTGDPVFDVVAAYATRYFQAAGVERVPFHLECKLDENGPCAIDVAARFASGGLPDVLSRLHPDRPDVFAVAAHDYLARNETASAPVDWTVYDQSRTVFVFGISEDEGVVETVDGLEAVEQLRGFMRWGQKPSVGDALPITRDLETSAWIVEMLVDGDTAKCVELADEIRAMIRINDRPRPVDRLNARVAHVTRRGKRKLRWIVRAGWDRRRRSH